LLGDAVQCRGALAFAGEMESCIRQIRLQAQQDFDRLPRAVEYCAVAASSVTRILAFHDGDSRSGKDVAEQSQP